MIRGDRAIIQDAGGEQVEVVVRCTLYNDKIVCVGSADGYLRVVTPEKVVQELGRAWPERPSDTRRICARCGMPRPDGLLPKGNRVCNACKTAAYHGPAGRAREG